MMRWPLLDRKGFYGRVAKMRGPSAAAALIAHVNREWKKANATTREDAERIAAKRMRLANDEIEFLISETKRLPMADGAGQAGPFTRQATGPATNLPIRTQNDDAQ